MRWSEIFDEGMEQSPLHKHGEQLSKQGRRLKKQAQVRDTEERLRKQRQELAQINHS